MRRLSRRRAPARRRVFHAAALQPRPDLEGMPLATPRQRVAAFVIDVLLVLIPSLLVSVSASFAALAIRDPVAFDALRTLATRSPEEGSAEEIALLARLAPLLVRANATGLPPAVAAAVENGDLERAGRMLSGYDFSWAVGDGSPTIAPRTVRVHIDRLMPDTLRTATLFGVAALYFTLLTVGGRRTVGKRLMGIHVTRLDGGPLTAWESFERFGGYFVAVGTFGLGLLDLWRDPNGRMAHDRLADTIVLTGSRVDAPEDGQ